jgi:hypothetical protein
MPLLRTSVDASEELTMMRLTQRTRHRWTPEEIAILGTIPDEDA